MTAFERYKQIWDKVMSRKPGDPDSDTNRADEEIDISALPLLASEFTKEEWAAFAEWMQEDQQKRIQEMGEEVRDMQMAVRLMEWDRNREWMSVPEDVLAHYTDRAANSVDPMIRLTSKRILEDIRGREA